MTASASPAPQAASRVSATPYARRLARDRGVLLAAIAGTGPNGRRTGRDVLAHVATPQPLPAPATTAAPAMAPATAALAATVSLDAIAGLLPQFESFEPEIELVDVCLKAVAATLRSSDALAGAAIVLTPSGGVLDGLDRLTLGAIAALRRADRGPAPRPDRPVLEVSWLARDGIRPIALPLRPGVAARIMLAGTLGSPLAECLMSYDPARLDDTAAADFLLAFRGWLEVPLRMIA
jgi:pyruvate dehydrogenase E2 component (dihydrolipoamide acetyltransferase)